MHMHMLGPLAIRRPAQLRESLIRGNRSRIYCEEALRPLASIVKAFGEEVAAPILPLLSPLLTLPLSPHLLDALHAITTYGQQRARCCQLRPAHTSAPPPSGALVLSASRSPRARTVRPGRRAA